MDAFTLSTPARYERASAAPVAAAAGRSTGGGAGRGPRSLHWLRLLLPTVLGAGVLLCAALAKAQQPLAAVVASVDGHTTLVAQELLAQTQPAAQQAASPGARARAGR